MMGRMKFNAEQCVGCYACHMACLDAHHSAKEIHARSFRGSARSWTKKRDFLMRSVRGARSAEHVPEPVPRMRFSGRKTMASIWWIGRNVLDAAFVQKLARIT